MCIRDSYLCSKNKDFSINDCYFNKTLFYKFYIGDVLFKAHENHGFWSLEILREKEATIETFVQEVYRTCVYRCDKHLITKFSRESKK